MKFRKQVTLLLCSVAAVTLIAQVVTARNRAPAEDVPGLLDLTKVKFEIIDVLFVKKLQGINSTFTESQEDKFRGMVLTLKVQKPAGEELTLKAQDLVLHYRYGSEFDIAKCHGLSTFSVEKDVDRPMNLFSSGLGGSTTGTSTVKASVVYIDLFFQYMEPNTSELHLLVAQPIGVSFKTDGWQ